MSLSADQIETYCEGGYLLCLFEGLILPQKSSKLKTTILEDFLIYQSKSLINRIELELPWCIRKASKPDLILSLSEQLGALRIRSNHRRWPVEVAVL